jgi:hypothetical protein
MDAWVFTAIIIDESIVDPASRLSSFQTDYIITKANQK